jgi:hypothetical protein
MNDVVREETTLHLRLLVGSNYPYPLSLLVKVVLLFAHVGIGFLIGDYIFMHKMMRLVKLGTNTTRHPAPTAVMLYIACHLRTSSPR